MSDQSLDLSTATKKQIWGWVMQWDDGVIALPSASPGMVQQFQKYFQCKRGGDCCTREQSSVPGFEGIWLDTEEVARLASLKGLSVEQFTATYCFRRPSFSGEQSFAMSYPCPFYEQRGSKGVCTIHNQRPYVCEMYPLNVSPQDDGVWRLSVSQSCPGGKFALYRILVEVAKENRGK